VIARRSAFGRDAGLTLVELLVVLAVLGLLAGLMATGLHIAAAEWQRVASHNSDREGLDAARASLRVLLSQIYPARFEQSGRTIMRFEGGEDGMSFLAPLAQRFGAQDIAVYRLQFTGDGTLSISWRLDRPDTAGQDDIAPPFVTEGIAGWSDGSFAYYGKSDTSDNAQWWSSWRAQSALPTLIRVHFTWRGKVQEMLVAPLITGAVCAASTGDTACLN
jgi:prepilin-type N-terminal cleavage/methylation domain-containing protein